MARRPAFFHAMPQQLRRLALLAVACVAAAAGPAGQAAPARPGQQPSGRVSAGKRGHLLQQLNLSPTQQVRLNTLIDEERAQHRQRLTHRPNEDEHAAALARQADLETKIMDILTPEQYDKYQLLRGLRSGSQTPEMRVPGSPPR